MQTLPCLSQHFNGAVPGRPMVKLKARLPCALVLQVSIFVGNVDALLSDAALRGVPEFQAAVLVPIK